MDDRSAQNAPTVSVIIPHFRDLVRLDQCLTALERQSYPSKRFEIVVADNNSPEGRPAIEAVIRGRAKLVIVDEPGAGIARNGGSAAASGDVLAFIDSDCVAEPTWLEEGVTALSRGDLAGGRVNVLVEDPAAPLPTEAFEVVFAFDNQKYVERLGFTVTANLFCPRRVFDAVGGFRSGLSEDLEWCHRARAMGFRLIYASPAVVGHPARRTWDELTKKWTRLTAEAYGLTAGHRARRLRWVLRACLLPASAVAHTPKVLGSASLSSWAERGGALSILYRIRIWRCFNALSLLTATWEQ